MNTQTVGKGLLISAGIISLLDIALWFTGHHPIKTIQSLQEHEQEQEMETNPLETSDSIQFPPPLHSGPSQNQASPPLTITWGYEGAHGPNAWGSILGAKICETGEKQSPIAIETGKNTGILNIKPDQTLPALAPHWHPSQFNILNNGHTIEMSYDPGSFVEFNQEKYQLKQFHFHSPSEHMIDGKLYPLEAHFVHATNHPENPHRLVVSVLFDEGFENPHLQKVWNHIPQNSVKAPIQVDQLEINARDFLPVTTTYFNYQGSLTTPPCTEGITWIILSHPMFVSKEQVQHFQKVLKGPNNRPIQPLNGRSILNATQIY